MHQIQPSISLKVFAEGIKCLHDPNWTGMYLYGEIKQHVRGRVEPVNLLRKPLEKGIAYYLGLWIFDEFFSEVHAEYLHGEYKWWFLNDFLELLKFHSLPRSTEMENLEKEIEKIDNLFVTEEDEYYDYLDSKEGNKLLLNLYKACTARYEKDIKLIRPHYAEEFSDRILHDRQLCFYISQLLVEIGFDGDDGETGPKQWVSREYWPERVKAILKSRDRGKCTNCMSDLTMELEAPIHIDHMIPIAKGGCNDIVNLQILCDKCNQSKSAKFMDVPSSIPRYIKRKSA